jgi:two-component system, sensor histidine kinase ChiS
LQKNVKFSDIPFIFLSAKSGKDDKYTGLKKGVIDYITKPFLIDELMLKIDSIISFRIRQIETMKNNIVSRFYNEPDFSAKPGNEFINIKSKYEIYKITDKEKEIIQLLIKGYEYKRIGIELNNSQNTIKKYIQNIYKKCKVNNKVELINIFK